MCSSRRLCKALFLPVCSSIHFHMKARLLIATRERASRGVHSHLTVLCRLRAHTHTHTKKKQIAAVQIGGRQVILTARSDSDSEGEEGGPQCQVQ